MKSLESEFSTKNTKKPCFIVFRKLQNIVFCSKVTESGEKKKYVKYFIVNWSRKIVTIKYYFLLSIARRKYSEEQ